MLCSCCSAIFEGELPPLFENFPTVDGYSGIYDREKECSRPLHIDISEVCNGVLDGCQICDMTWRHFFKTKTPAEYCQDPIFVVNGHAHIYTGSGMNRESIGLKSNWKLKGDRDALSLKKAGSVNTKRFLLTWCSGAGDEPAVDLDALPKPSASIYGPNTFTTIQKWISDCQNNHKKCNLPSSDTQWYPTRLLDIQYTPSDDPVENLVDLMQLMTSEIQPATLPAHVRLIETAKEHLTGPYMTLSHRWPDHYSKTITTRPTNLQQRKRRIRAQELPRNFEEAIQFTRALGVRYLWIDSLCIIQDDQEDWEREAPVMGEVYANSLLNISATAAKYTLIQPRNPRLIEPCIVKSDWEGQDPETYILTDFYFWDRVQKSPANQRAWIAQERWLSKRVLHFTFDQLIWECKELEAAESFPNGLFKEAKSYKHANFKAISTKEQLERRRRHPDPSEQELQHADWCKVLGTYGRSELTKEKDRLVAISGVAGKFSEQLQDEWVAGLWKRLLPGDLLWQVWKCRRSNKPAKENWLATLNPSRNMFGGVAEASRLSTYQAPSWSWASVYGDIDPGFYVPEGDEDAMIETLDIVITPLNPRRPLGQLKYANIKLKGAIYPFAMDPPNWPNTGRSSYLTLPPKIYIAGTGKKPHKARLGGDMAYEMHTHSVHVHPDEPLEYSDVARSCFLPVAKHYIDKLSAQFDWLQEEDENGNKTGAWLVRGLCLQSTGKQGEYKRLGRVDWLGDEAQLFIDDLELRRGHDDTADLKPFEPALDSALYHEDELGVLTIV